MLGLQSPRLGSVAQLSEMSTNKQWREAMLIKSLDDVAQFLSRCMPNQRSVENIKEHLIFAVDKVSGVRRAAGCGVV